MRNVKKTLTEGPIFFRLFLFSLPIMASGLLQVMYNMADNIIVGNFSGDNLALAATIELKKLFFTLYCRFQS